MYLYLLTNTARDPQKSYVGITSRPVNRRLMEHFNTASKKTTLIARALHKYGSKAFALTVLGQAESWEELCAMEQAAIIQYNTFVPHGYNLTRGGDGTLGWKHSPEAIELMRQANLGRVMPQSMRDAVGARMRGVPKSPEQRAKMGEWQRGEKNSQYGKKLEPEHRAKMLAGIAKIREEKGDPRKGRPISDTHKANLSQALKGRKQSPEEIEHRRQKLLGQKRTDATKAKLRAKALEQFARQGNPMQGRTHSAETKEKIAAKRRGRPGWNKGKKTGPLSAETKAKLSAIHQGQAAWNKGISYHEMTGGKEHPKARAVEYNGVVYASVMECHTKTGLARNTIKNHIKQGKAKYMPTNIILTPAMAGTLEGPPMADAPAVNPADVFPRYGFSATEPGTPVVDSATGVVTCNSRLFENKAELDAAGGTAVWSLTPDAAAKAKAPAPRTPAADDEEDAPARRSHR